VELTSLGYRTDLMMLSLQGSEIEDRGDHLAVRTPSQPTFHWGNFLLFADPPAGTDDADRWQALFEAEFPDAAHMTFGLDTTDGTVGDLSGFVAAGIAMDRSVVLTTSEVRPPPRPNTDVGLRMLTSDDDWSRAVELRMTIDDTVEDPGHRLFVQRRNDAMRALQEAGHGGWFGAFAGDRMVAGLGVYTDGGGIGRYQSVETHPGFRNRGLAGTLVHHAGRYALADLGVDRLVIVADPTHVASRIYRSVGFDGTETQIGLART
jgi:GNAT superfamily N-acetyltransferase